jgi:hypothetical protein
VLTRLSIVVSGAVLLAAGPAHAEPCALVVALEGEPAAVETIGDRLTARGISTDTSACAGVRTRVERRGADFVIVFVAAEGGVVERVVSDPGTAATVIESFVRVDVASPLLASRPLPPGPARTVHREPAPTSAPPSALRERTGVHVFGSLDSTVASDRTAWLGMQVGACIMLSVVCPSARFRFDMVMTGTTGWAASTTRNSSDLLVGVDVPLAVASWMIVPGVAIGMGGIRTDYEPAIADSVKRETTGLRGELHATVLVPLSPTLAVDLSAAGVLLQETKIDEGAMTSLPGDPLRLVRFGVGLRYGRR